MLLSLLLNSLSGLDCLDIYLNDKLSRHWDDLAPYLYSVPGSGSGIALAEILPLVTEAHKLKVRGIAGYITFTEDNLADRLSGFRLEKNKATYSLTTGSRQVNGVTALYLYGTPLSARELVIWLSWEGVPLLKQEIRRFEELHNVTVKVVDVPGTESKLISVLRGGGLLPDIVMVQSDQIPGLTSSGALQNLGYMPPGALSPKGLAAFRLDGKQWAIPFYYDVQLAVYNRDLIPGPLPPEWDLSLLEKTAAGLKETLPLCWNAYSAYWLIPFQLGFGKPSLVEADGSIRVNDHATMEALAYINNLRDRKLMEVKERDAMVSLFVSGKTAIILTGSYSIPAFEELGLNFGVMPLPFNRETGKHVSPLLDFKGFTITRKTRRPVLARRLIEYLTGPGVQQRFTLAIGKVPANTDAWVLLQAEHPYYAVLEASSQIGSVLPPARAYPVFKNTMWKLLRFIFSGGMTVREALDTGQEIIDTKLQRNH